jgi:hypothetical protein
MPFFYHCLNLLPKVSAAGSELLLALLYCRKQFAGTSGGVVRAFPGISPPLFLFSIFLNLAV